MRKLLSGIITAALLTSPMSLSFIPKVFAAESTLFINEVMAANSTIRDGDINDVEDGSKGGAFSDWIEIYNSGTSAVALTGYTISDSGSTWAIPQGSIPAKGYLLIWASGKNKVASDGQLHTNFKISDSGEALTLKKPDGTIASTVTTGSLEVNQSYGRKIDGASEFVVFSKSTPGTSNINGIIHIDEPAFSVEGGFYPAAFNLNLSHNDSNVKIYYTKDGSDPEPGKTGTTLYQSGSAINIQNRSNEPYVFVPEAPGNGSTSKTFKYEVIKAIAIRNDGACSSMVTKSYFVNAENNFGDLPVISLVTDKSNLFGEVAGLFRYPTRDIEVPFHVEFFEKKDTNNSGSYKYTFGFSKYCGVKVHGNNSAGMKKSSVRLYADSGYDESNKIKYNVFPSIKDSSGTEVLPQLKDVKGNDITDFKRLILRNSGQDCQKTMFRDALMHELASDMKFDTQAYRPAVVFINGEYWGIYNIRERYDNIYFASHYNIDKDNVALIGIDTSSSNPDYFDLKEGDQQDLASYKSFVDYLLTNDITTNENYNHIKTLIDIDNFIDYNVANIYYYNTDWEMNNVSIFKDKTQGHDGRWKWALRDTDSGFSNPTFDFLNYVTKDDGTNLEYYLLKTLLKNSEFRNEFINRFADHMNTTFKPERVNKVIAGIKNLISKEIPDDIDRWHSNSNNWDQNVQVLTDFANARPGYMKTHIINRFKLAGTADITLNTDTTKGNVRINSIDIKSTTPGITNIENWTGTYYKGVPVTLKASPEAGYKAIWSGVDNIIAKTEDSITFMPNGNMNISIAFRKYGDLDNDGLVSAIDFGLFRKHLLGSASLPTDALEVADLDLDGSITTIDFGILRLYLLGDIKTLPHTSATK